MIFYFIIGFAILYYFDNPDAIQNDYKPVVCMFKHLNLNLNILYSKDLLFNKNPKCSNSNINEYNHPLSSVEIFSEAKDHYDIFETGKFWNSDVFKNIDEINITDYKIFPHNIHEYWIIAKHKNPHYEKTLMLISFEIISYKIQSIQIRVCCKTVVDKSFDTSSLFTLEDLSKTKQVEVIFT
jgi:hypothetical protein